MKIKYIIKKMNKKNLIIKKTLVEAFQNHQKNNLTVAENLYKKILKINPDHFESILLLGSLSVQIKNFYIAIKLLNKAVQLQPNHANANYNLGLAFTELKEFKKAMIYCQKAIKIAPNHVEAYNNLGNVFKELREFQKAKNCYQKAIQFQPGFLKAHNNLGNILKELGEFKKAKNCYHKVIQIQPSHANAHYNLALLFKVLGDFQKTISSYQEVLKYEPENLTAFYELSNLKKEILNLNLKNKVNKILKNEKCKIENRAYGNFLLAKYELKEKNYREEFDYLLKGHMYYFESENKKFNKGIKYWLGELPKTRELLNFNKNNKKIKKIDYDIKPIFIIGFPRCGSTLVEKIIASCNEHIPIGEETNVLTTFIGKKMLQKKSLNLDIENSRFQLYEEYKQKGLIQKKSDYIFTDKSLDNFFYLGVIREIFPNAKIIHCKRNPLSSIMSLLKTNLREVTWAHNLKHIFEFFNIYYNMTENFKKIYPNFIYELQYEKFVSNPISESKKLTKFCGLKWNKKCLEFYKRKDLISKTASNVQVRNAVYTDSIKKYLPYKQFLDKYGKKYSWFY